MKGRRLSPQCKHLSKKIIGIAVEIDFSCFRGFVINFLFSTLFGSGLSELGRLCMEFCRIAPDVILGKDVKIHAYVNLYGCSIGDNTKIGAFVEIQKGARIGKNCKISSHTFICEGVTIKDNVFVGHNVTFINDKYPKATNEGGRLQTEEDWSVVPSIVEEGVSVGSSVTILCGITNKPRLPCGMRSIFLRCRSECQRSAEAGSYWGAVAQPTSLG